MELLWKLFLPHRDCGIRRPSPPLALSPPHHLVFNVVYSPLPWTPPDGTLRSWCPRSSRGHSLQRWRCPLLPASSVVVVILSPTPPPATVTRHRIASYGSMFFKKNWIFSSNSCLWENANKKCSISPCNFVKMVNQTWTRSWSRSWTWPCFPTFFPLKFVAIMIIMNMIMTISESGALIQNKVYAISFIQILMKSENTTYGKFLMMKLKNVTKSDNATSSQSQLASTWHPAWRKTGWIGCGRSFIRIWYFRVDGYPIS